MRSASVHLIVSGRVQGVGFRYFIQERALQLSLTGVVRNLFDGKVEIIAEGEHQALETLIEMARQGPRSARVERVIIDWKEQGGTYATFEAR